LPRARTQQQKSAAGRQETSPPKLPRQSRQNDFASAIYNGPAGAHDAAPFGETTIPQASQPAENKIMGDKSPKSNQKKSSQKQIKADTASQKQKAAAAAKSAVKKK
jgi:hypothetical protein